VLTATVNEPDAAVAAATEMPAIELAGIEKTYRSSGERFAAVKGVDLRIGGGEFFSLLGPSGCGKTTTLRIIAGFEQPSAGAVRLYGQDVTDVGPDKRDVNLVFQNYALFPHLNVYDNIAFGLRRRGVRKPELTTRVGDIIEAVQLGGFERRLPKQLSGGQQQRVALARALVNRPRALLLDEPLGALDLKLRQAMQIELKRIQRDVGITFLYVTHDQSEALTMSDRLAVMRDGRIEQLGTPREVYDEPATAFVAGFVGASNVLAGQVRAVAGGSVVLDLGEEERVVVPVAGQPESASPVTGGQVSFTVRPEKVAISSDRPDRPCRLRGRVSEVIFLGTSTTYLISTALADEVTVFQQNGDAAAQLARGDEVWLSWREESARSFGSTALESTALESTAFTTTVEGNQ
jgi:spermidine/putrescine transport system ATP-binding protein